MFDLIVRNAVLVDGTGAAARSVDVATTGDRICAVGTISPNAPTARTVDARQRVLAPGFIDIHTHSDLHLVEDGAGESKLRQGVTTEVTGNCSFSPFPLDQPNMPLHVDHLARATAKVPLRWTGLSGYADALTERGLGLNVAPLAGHGTLRVAAMGLEQREPDADELARMTRELDASLNEGAWGMSTGLTHVPSAYAEFDEIAALARVLASHGALYTTHSRGGGVDESVALGRASGVRVQHSHLAINNPKRWGTGHLLLEALDRARSDGVDIAYDVYPYAASSSSLTQHLPLWLQAGGTGPMRERLKDPRVRDRALRELATGWFGGIPFLWDRFLISHTPDGHGVGQTIEALAEATSSDPYDYLLELCEKYGNEVRVVIFYRAEEDVEAFLAHPLAVVGSDGNAMRIEPSAAGVHPRSFGTFPRVLGRYVRERGVLALPDAVHKMTGAPAARLGLRDRGVIREGLCADMVIFDPARVADNAEFAQPPRRPDGIDMVVVNGTVMVEDDTISADRPGRVLLRSG